VEGRQGGRGPGGGHVTLHWCWLRSPFVSSGGSSRSVGTHCLQALVVREWGASSSVEGLLSSTEGSFSFVFICVCLSRWWALVPHCGLRVVVVAFITVRVGLWWMGWSYGVVQRLWCGGRSSFVVDSGGGGGGG
jgi:hypothetical protein